MKNRALTKFLDKRLAAPMFVLALVALGLFACLIYLHSLANGWILIYTVIGLAIIYPLFWAEAAAHLYAGSSNMRQHIWFCLLPMTRIGSRDHSTGQKIWLPALKWREVDRVLEKTLVRHFSIPMIVTALMVLPIIVLEFYYKDFVDSNQGWRLAMCIAEACIWAAFTFEFVLMMWVVKYPMSYVKKHWIDLAIILLPTLAFMRTMRLASIGRLNQLAKTARVFRMRGLGMRLWRGFVALEIIEMLLSRNPERRLEKLELQLEDKMEEIDWLKKDIARLQDRVEKRRLEKEANQEEPEEGTHDLDSSAATSTVGSTNGINQESTTDAADRRSA